MEEMTSRERLLSSILGKEADHVPFSPFLAYYFDFLPPEVRARGDMAYLQEMGADPLFRGGVCAYQVHARECTEDNWAEGNKRYRVIHTPKGDLRFESTYLPKANTTFLTKHPVEDAEQIPAAIAYFQDLEITENIQAANEAVRNLGENGLHIAILGANFKSAYQFMIETLVGTENLVYLTMDEPELLEELLAVIVEKDRQTVQYTAESDVLACLSWEDSSTQNTSPALYEKYIAPEIREWCDILRDAGKPYIQHACGHVHDLLLPMANEGVTAVESISPAPTGNVDMHYVFDTLPEHVAVIGGIEPVQFLESPLEDLLAYAEDLIRSRGKHGFILANSDSCPPGVSYEKFVELAKLVKRIH